MDLEGALVDEPRFLVDPRFQATLHGEMVRRLGAEEAAAALVQLGFLHGLRDATQVLSGSSLLSVGSTSSSRLAMRFGLHHADAPKRPLEVHGAWPERREARAVRAALGRCEAPACHASAGYTSGWLSGLFESDVLAVEVSCRVRGDAECRFVAREVEAWAAADDPAAQSALRRLPFRALREALAEDAPGKAPAPEAVFDPDSPAIHVWGPVMVIPFSGAEETLSAVELIGHDPGARNVVVVVLDLAGTLLDEGFGALALERILEAVHAWGAETLLTGVSPLSGSVVAELEQPHLQVDKSLQEAIALAFQIAEARRRTV